MRWEVVIGLEIHVQLNTKTKLFSSALNHFGDEPNTNIQIVDTGQPGSLPVLNKEAVKKAIVFGLAIDAEIAKYSKFDRKSYFYPDSPRNFQITQFDHPIIGKGKIETDIDGENKTFFINRAHLEDDAGMLKHFTSFTGVDYNRAGVPLLEIVSEPCITSAKEAIAYVKAIKAILEYTDVSECNMEQGHLRVDANISVKRPDEKTLRPKAEIKNMNSFTFLEIAINAEIQRQIELYEEFPKSDPETIMVSGTYRWDGATKQTKLMRIKESADDYRYFSEPDLPPIVLNQKCIDNIKKMLPELPKDRFKRYVTKLELTPYAANTLIIDKKLSDYFEEALNFCSNPRVLCNWITVEFAGKLKETGQSLFSLNISSKHIGILVDLIDKKIITGKIAKQVAEDMLENPDLDPTLIVKNNPNYQPLNDEAAIELLVEKVLEENPQSIEDYFAGREKAFAFLVGQVMKLTKGKASPTIVNELIHKKLDAKK